MMSNNWLTQLQRAVLFVCTCRILPSHADLPVLCCSYALHVCLQAQLCELLGHGRPLLVVASDRQSLPVTLLLCLFLLSLQAAAAGAAGP
jgi:hypothetical protein